MALRIHDPMMRGMDLIALSIVLKSIEVGIVCFGISGAPSDSGTTLPSGRCSSRPRAAFRGALGRLRPPWGFRRLPGSRSRRPPRPRHLADSRIPGGDKLAGRSEEHTSELQSPCNLV